MSIRTIRCGLVLALLAGAAEAQKAGAVDAVKAQAIIQRSTTQLAAEKGTSVSWDDLLHTDIRGRLRVELLDQSLISLGPDSQVRVIRQAPSSEQSALELAYGKLRMRLAKQPGQRFELRTPTAVAGVIGTDFGADASVPGTTHFICLEGEVRISSSDPKIPGTVICKGGYMTDVKAGQPPAEPMPAPAEHMQNWRRNNEPDGNQDTTDHAHQH
jgi:ferric-dicitrate binding protein FerR (iron transport regulator)